MTTNPYVLGVKGFWKPKKSYLHLTGRTQSKFDGNTNIRKDGIFTSFNPFYENIAGNWSIDQNNWTYTSEVTETSPYGPEVENKDALGRYSSATFGYNQSLATAVAANSKYKEVGFDNFEDYDFSDCADNHFKFKKTEITLTNSISHTGRKSIKVAAGSPVSLIKQLSPCVNPCNINLSSYTPSSIGIVSTIGGTPPFNYTYNITYGSPNITLINNGLNLQIVGPNYGVQVTVTDANGCTTTKFYQAVFN
jgi:hypothetical protein